MKTISTQYILEYTVDPVRYGDAHILSNNTYSKYYFRNRSFDFPNQIHYNSNNHILRWENNNHDFRLIGPCFVNSRHNIKKYYY